MGDVRVVTVPDGLAGERLDSAVARMFGVSRAQAAALAAAGEILVGGQVAAKSTRLGTGEVVEVRLPGPADELTVVPELVAGMSIVHEDHDIVVVDKPAGWPRIRVSAGTGQMCSPAWPPRTCGSPRPARQSAKVSSRGSMSARAA